MRITKQIYIANFIPTPSSFSSPMDLPHQLMTRSNLILPQTFQNASTLLKAGSASLARSARSSNHDQYPKEYLLGNRSVSSSRAQYQTSRILDHLTRKKGTFKESRVLKSSITHHEPSHDLEEIEDIIDQIQEVMVRNNPSTQSPSLKRQLQDNHPKYKWQGKGIGNKFKNDSLDRLEEMLINYTTQDTYHPQTPSVPLSFNQKTKNINRLEEVKRFHEVSRNLAGVQADPIDAELLQILWAKLPLIPITVSEQTFKVLIEVKSAPKGQQYLDLFMNKIDEIQAYSACAYSLFGGLAGSREGKLLSAEEFKQKWEQTSPIDDFTEQEKEIICQFELQWYFAIVLHCFGNSLQQILLKQIPYSLTKYQLTIKSLSLPSQQAHAPYSESLFSSNKLRYLKSLLQGRVKSTGKLQICLIPNIFEAASQAAVEEFKLEIQLIFKGEIYNHHQSAQLEPDSAMAVLILNSQSDQFKIQKMQDFISIDSRWKLYINREGYSDKESISVRIEKGKMRVCFAINGSNRFLNRSSQVMEIGFIYKLGE